MRDLKSLLRSLGLLVTASTFDEMVALATKKRWGPAELLEHVADLEDKDRARRGLERRMARSKLERFKPMADFEWDWPTTIDRGLVPAPFHDEEILLLRDESVPKLAAGNIIRVRYREGANRRVFPITPVEVVGRA